MIEEDPDEPVVIMEDPDSSELLLVEAPTRSRPEADPEADPESQSRSRPRCQLTQTRRLQLRAAWN